MTKNKNEPEAQPLGTNCDADKFRKTPNLAPSELFPGMQAVKPEEVAHNNGTRTGRNE